MVTGQRIGSDAVAAPAQARHRLQKQVSALDRRAAPPPRREQLLRNEPGRFPGMS